MITFAHEDLYVDGETHEISYVIEHRADFKIAEIIEFGMNGEKIDL